MNGLLPQFGLVFILIMLNAAFAGTELALVSLREGQLHRLEEESKSGARLAKLARQPNQFLATIQIGITLAGFLASATAAVSLAKPLEGPLSFLGGAAGATSVIVVTLVLAYLTLVFGELAPKRVAMQKAERWGLVMARPLAALTVLTRPAVWLLSHSTDAAVRLMGGDPSIQREEVTAEELRDLVDAQTSFTPQQRLIINGAFEIADRTLGEVLVPRSDVVSLHEDLSGKEGAVLLLDAGYSRAPVVAGIELDSVIGVVHLRHLLSAPDQPVSAVALEMPVFPDQARVLTTMRDLQARRTQMALVVDEHGGAEGIVTMEDLIEELVGEIYDESDTDLASVRYEPDGTVVLPGRFPIHDLTDIGISLPSGNYTTVAGLALDQFGHIPEAGESVTIEGWIIEVRSVERHAVVEVALRSAPVTEPEDPEDSED